MADDGGSDQMFSSNEHIQAFRSRVPSKDWIIGVVGLKSSILYRIGSTPGKYIYPINSESSKKISVMRLPPHFGDSSEKSEQALKY